MGVATMRVSRRAAALAVAVALTACATPGGPQDVPQSGGPCLSLQPSTWMEPADYTYDATITVYGPSHGTWRITVRDHAVARVEPLDQTAEYEASRPEWSGGSDFPTLASLETLYAEAGAACAHVATLERGADGTPRLLDLDMSGITYDDEYRVEVSHLTVP